MERGKFIVFEGADGSGKTTQAKLLFEYISKNYDGCKCIFTCEPTTGVFGKLCRDIGAGLISAEPDTQALLYAADRIEHIKTLIPELEKGNHIVCDRYYISSLAYQSVYADFDDILAYNIIPRRLLKADITFFIDVSLETCIKRRSRRRGAEDIYEKTAYAERVHEQYHYVLERLKSAENIRIINGEQSKSHIFGDILESLSGYI